MGERGGRNLKLGSRNSTYNSVHLAQVSGTIPRGRGDVW